MSNIFTAVKPALSAIDRVITHSISVFWISTLQAQLRYERQLQQ
ncbi:hypothetical protein [Bradyrhizobium sediminis]|nr:hypothetical protein [Bradyrhizobium sediminis]